MKFIIKQIDFIEGYTLNALVYIILVYRDSSLSCLYIR